MNALLAVLWKDLVVEWRTRERLAAMAVFVLAVVVIFQFATPPAPDSAGLGHLPGLLWVTTVLAALLGLNRSFALELAHDALSGLALAPTDRGFIFLGKALANLVLVSLVQILCAGLFALAFELPVAAAPGSLLLVALLGALGICSLGTLFSAMAARTAYREVLLPLLLLPLLIPVLLGSVRATEALLAGEGIDAAALRLLLVSDGVYLIVSFVGFEFVLDD